MEPVHEVLEMLPSDMNLRIGNVRNYNNKILISSPSFKIGTNVKINLDDDDTKVAKTDKLDVKHKVKDKPDIKPNKGDKQDVKPVIKPNKEDEQDVKPNIKFEQDVKKPDTNKITYEEEKVALILGTTAVFTVLWMFK